MKNINKNIYKNLACAFMGLLIIFVTSIFVAKNFYGQKIIRLIDERTLLKDYHYPSWGQFPGNLDADFTHQLSLYNLSTQSLSQLKTGRNQKSESAVSVSFAHQFKYKNIAYGQGNQGFIKYLHEWDRRWQNEEELKDVKISTINLVAEKVFDYEYISTESRRFVLMYNEMERAVRGVLPTLYSETLHQYYLRNRAIVEKTIFDQIQLKPETRDLIYSHPKYGWSNPDNLKVWIKLCHSKQRAFMEEYQLLQQAIGLTGKELEQIVGSSSIMMALSQALNGTIKYKIESNTYLYKACDPFCNDSHLVSIQLATGLLTNSPLFASVNLKKLVHQFNNSLPGFIQYSEFVKGLEPGNYVDLKNVIDMFHRSIFANFTYMSQIIKNKNNLRIVENIFGVQSPNQDGVYGLSIIQYMTYLQTHIFTAFDQQTQSADNNAYTYMFPNHIYINSIIERLRQTLLVELYTRALFKSFKDDQVTCTSFYDRQPYKKFADLCKNPELQITQNIKALRTFVKAYFFIERTQFIQLTNMTWIQASSFLRLDKASPFVVKISQMAQQFKTIFNCEEAVCSSQQLLVREWGGDSPILQNLPKKYFPNPVSILDWDVDNNFNGKEPQYYKVMKEVISKTDSQLYLGHGPQSILVLYNIMKYKLAMDKGDLTAAKIINYVQKVTLDVAFAGIFEVRPLSDVINGYSSDALSIKRHSDPLTVGASWLPESVSIVPTKSRPEYFSKVNTGIYDKDKLRTMLQVQESDTIGSWYTIYETQYNKVAERLDSAKKVFGTNLLGFHQDIGKEQILSAYLDFIHQGVLLNNIDSSYKFKNEIDAYKYAVTGTQIKTSVGVQQQNQRSIVISPDSYFIVEPLTGATLQLSVKYSVFSNLSFLKYYFVNQPNTQVKVYDMQIRYSRKDIADLVEIRDTKSTLITLYIVAIALATISCIGVIIGTILYCYKARPRRTKLTETMVSSVYGSESIKIG